MASTETVYTIQYASSSNTFCAKLQNAQGDVVVNNGHARLFCVKFDRSDYERTRMWGFPPLPTLLVWNSYIPHHLLCS
ncbi:hypothetical protein Y032_0058g2854 [Ancylostoma ceylanicum]|uniref:Uncharacterized protein n=1 Tax=Ancylostoma ceylanicum TaxID=53326 RepID=A0A016U3X2_9BILA|nr:hypothetical protein Y032_0058g2854 [Ancylostoma ceylanicum]